MEIFSRLTDVIRQSTPRGRGASWGYTPIQLKVWTLHKSHDLTGRP